MTTEMQRPAPYPSPETQPFWDGCKRHELTLPYCTKCSEFFFYPRQFCPKCFSWDIEWRKCSGKGTLHTFAIQFRMQMPGFTPPYVTAMVQLDEGPRMMTNLVGVDPMPENIKCGIPVEVVWEQLNDEITLPLFKPVAS
jgi:uncharacterized OB-fold protein